MAINRDKVLREAEKLVQRGKIEQAIREYEKLLEANPNDANTINRVGDLYGRIGETGKAVELYVQIADYFTQDGFTTKAIAILKKINRLAPERLDIFVKLAELYTQQGLVVEAKNQWMELADVYTRNGDNAKAIDAHRKLIQLDQSNHMACLKLADLLLKVGQAEEALGEYARLGQVLLAHGRLDEAERLFRHAVDQNPPSGEFLAPLCSALLEAGRTTTAKEFLQAALTRSPASQELQVMALRAKVALGDASQALVDAEELLERDPDNEQVRALLAQGFLRTGEALKARDILLPLVERVLKRGDFQNAQRLIQDLLKAMPKDVQVLGVALRAYEPSGEQKMVFAIKAGLADSYFRSGQKEVARRLYLELLGLEPDNNLFRQRLAQLGAEELGTRGAPTLAEEAEVESIDLDFEAHQPEIPSSPAPSPAAAEPAAAPPAARAGFDPEERLAEANVFAKYGLVDKAINHLEEIVRAFPANLDARAKLVQLLVEQGRAEVALPVARPLVDAYRAAGKDAELQALTSALPQLAGAAAARPARPSQPTLPSRPAALSRPRPAPAVEEQDEEVLLVEVDEEPAEEIALVAAPPETPDLGTSGWGEESGDDVIVVLDDEAGGLASDLATPAEEMDESAAVVILEEPEPGEEAEPDLSFVVDLQEPVRPAPTPAEPLPTVSFPESATPTSFDFSDLAPHEVSAPPPSVPAPPVKPMAPARPTPQTARPAPAPRPAPEPVRPLPVEPETPVVEAPPPTVEAPRPETPSPSLGSLAAAAAEGWAPPSPPAAAARERSGPALSLDELERSLVAPTRKPTPSRRPAAAADVSELFSDLVSPPRGRSAAAAPPVPEQPVQARAEASAPPEVLPVEMVPVAPSPPEPPAVEAPPAPAATGREKAEPAREELVEISSFAGPPLDDLQQIDFFIQQELFEDALRLLDRLTQEYPQDAELAERRLTLKAKGVLLDEVTETGEAPDDLFAEEEQFFDLAKELEEELAEEDAMVAEATGRGKGEAELEEVFKEFQKGVAEQISEEDSATHFNLGIAYREMGLLPEAIREFQISSRDSSLLVDSCSMIGVCYTDQGMGESAAEWYRRALEAPELTSEQRLGLRYELGSALESAGDVDQAAEVFEELVAAQPTYRDVSARYALLSQQRHVN